MGTYKVIQDIEADDKLVGPFSLRQFIYVCVCGLGGWLSFLAVVNNLAFFLVLTVPVILFAGFLAFPWGKDQPTELWLLAKLRFFLKPHKRIWDQTGAKDLVTITVPKKIERVLTNGLTQAEVRNRLGALANTIDSRGWAIKNMNVNMMSTSPSYAASDRLVDVSTMPQEVTSVDVTASDDMLDEQTNPVAHQFDTMIAEAENAKRQELMAKMSDAAQPTPPSSSPVVDPAQSQVINQAQPDYWFLGQTTPQNSSAAALDSTSAATVTDQPVGFPVNDTPSIGLPLAATPTSDDATFLAQHRVDQGANLTTSRLKTIKTPEQLAEEAKMAREKADQLAAEVARQQAAELEKAKKAQVTSDKQVAIINLSRTDDQDVATLGRRAQREIEDEIKQSDDGEVVIPLR